MAAISVGSVAVDVVPSVKSFAADLKKSIVPQASGVGEQIGKQIGAGITKGIGDPISGPLDESTKRQRSRAPKQGEELGGAFATGFKKRLQTALASLPKIKIDADSSDADKKLAELRTRMEALAGKTIGVDIDAAAALAELNAIKVQLGKVGENASIDVRADTAQAIAQIDAVQAQAAKLAGETANVQVDADTAKADAELAATDAEVSRLDGRKASVDVDTSGAVSSLLRLSGIVGGLGPLFLGLGAVGAAGIAALAAPTAAAAAGFGGLALVAVPAITRIKTALDAQKTAQEASAAGSAQAQGRALAEAAAQQQLAAAVRNAAAAHQQAVDQVRSAEQQLAAAQQTAANAQRELTQARLDAQRALQDMKNQVIDAGLAIRQSQLDVDQARASLDQMRASAAAAAQGVAQAQTRLAQAQAAQAALAADPGATDTARQQAAANTAAAQAALKSAQDQQKARQVELRQAQLAYEQAIQRLKEQQLQLQRLQQDEKAAAKAGVDGSNQVVAARQRLAAANQQITNTELALSRARQNVARVDQSSADQIASAQRSAAQAALQGASANSALATSMAALSPSARGLMTAWQGFSRVFTAWQTSLEPTVLPVLARGLGVLRGLFPLITPVVQGAARALDGLFTALGRTLASPAWQQFAGTLGSLVQGAMSTFGTVALQLATTLVRLLNAFAPFAPIALGFVTQLGNLVASVGQQLAGLAPVVAPLFSVLGQLAQALGPLLGQAIQALAPVIAGLLPILSAVIRFLQPVISALIAGLRPILIALVPVVGLLVNALGQILDALAPILPVLGQFIGSLISGLMPILRPILTVIAQLAARLAGALIVTLRAALPSVQQIVIAIASLLPALLPLLPLWVRFQLAVLPLLPALVRLVAIIVQLLVPILRVVIEILVAIVTAILNKVLPVFKWLVSIVTWAINLIHGLFKWLYNELIGHSIIPDLVNGIRTWFNILAGVFRWIYNNIIHPIINAIGSVIHTVWVNVIRPVFDAIRSAVGRVADAFKLGVKAISAAWDKLKSYTSAPVRWVIDKVINHGVLWAWDTVAKWLHLPAALQIPYLKLPFADGGIVKYYANGGVENHAAQIAPAGAMRVWAEPETGGEAYIPLASSKRGRSTQILGAVADHFGYGLVPFADGGFWGSVGHLANSILGKGLSLGKAALSAVTDPAKWILNHLTQPVKTLLAKVEGSNFGRASVAIGEKTLSAMTSSLKKLLDLFAGGGGSAMVQLARTQVGYHEGPGNSNKYSTAIGRPAEEWCFAAGTLVDTPDGPVPIETLNDGDLVISATGVPRKVLATNRRLAPETLVITAPGVNGTRTTPEHPYWTPGGWVDAGDLRPGDKIDVAPTGHWADGHDWVPITSITPADGVEVFNITVADEHTFIADGAAVHNCADFIDWLAQQTGNRAAVPWTASAPGMASAFGSRYVSGTSGAVPGDVVFFGPNKGGIYHVGLAAGNASGSTIPTIAGNHGDAVRAYTGTGIAGYAHPNYPNPGSVGSAPGSLVHASPGTAQAWARQNLKDYGWSLSQYSPLVSLWNRESNWRWNATNPSSGAYGIPQSLPASKMRSAGADWHDNAGTQIKWGLGYIRGRYGSPAAAWSHEISSGWYDQGGWLPPGPSLVYNGTGQPEPVFTHRQFADLVDGRSGGTQYHAHFDGWTAGALEGRVRTAFHAMEVSNAHHERIGRRG